MIKLIFSLCLFSATSVEAVTLSTVRTDCRILVRDTGDTRRRYSDSQLNRFLNEGQRDLAVWSRGLRKTREFELVAGTTYYAMPSDFVFPVRVTRDFQVISEKSVANLDKNDSWQLVGGQPDNYFMHFSSRTKMGFYPFPDTTSSTGTIRVDYIAQSTDMSADSDSVFNGITELQPFAYLVSLYCGYRAALVYGQTDLAGAYYGEYKRGADQMGQDATSRPAYKPPAVGGGQN